MKRSEKIMRVSGIAVLALSWIGMKVADGQSPTQNETLDVSAVTASGAAVIMTQDYKKLTIMNLPESVTFTGGVAGNWLTVERQNKKDPDARGFDPIYTTVTCNFKPVPRKRTDGKWEITFESELDHGRR